MSGKDRVKELRELAERVKGAKGVMVVGAGPTGIELAAELGAAYPRVPVKLVTNKYEIGAGMPKRWAALQQSFASRQSPSSPAAGSVLDAKRHGDVVFMCADGQQLPRRRFAQTSLDAKVSSRRDPRGGCSVSPTSSRSGMRQDVRHGRERDGDDERAVPARARHRKFARRVCASNVLRCIAGEALVDKAAPVVARGWYRGRGWRRGGIVRVPRRGDVAVALGQRRVRAGERGERLVHGGEEAEGSVEDAAQQEADGARRAPLHVTT